MLSERIMTVRKATDVFSEWALRDRDEGMEEGHAKSVNDMLKMVIPKFTSPFSVIDVGCGNGWVCRYLESIENCYKAVGVDGSKEMILKAKIKGDGEFHLAQLPFWKPSIKFDLIHSMEFLYYLHDPFEMLKIFYEEWLKPGGILIAGIDHYSENTISLGWPKALNVNMSTFSENEWRKAMLDAGFIDVKIQRVGIKEGFVGTLAMLGQKLN
ncbi:MAG: trans-aconitate methyltransferase [Candidatus Thalassarchaeaceae archaeon]|jgi:trans-aconitate methyltransferase|tara:strand:- start:5833 stop:6468 length:636 start_codon:yes stop_codon:yes gene_type:complete